MVDIHDQVAVMPARAPRPKICNPSRTFIRRPVEPRIARCA